MSAPRWAPPPRFLHQIGTVYGRALQRHGARPGGVGWSSVQSQQVRFQAVLRLLAREPEGAVVSAAELGCGYGALWPLLRDLAAPRISAYTGYDISPAMVRRATRLHGRDPRVRFITAAQVTLPADYGFVSGTFNYRRDIPVAEWEDYVRESLTQMAGQCRRGLAFNLLHRRTLRKRGLMYYADPDAWRRFAETLAGPRRGTVALADDYLPDDFTLLVWFGD